MVILQDIPFIEIGLFGIILTMIYGSSRDKWSFVRHDLSLLGSRNEKEGMRGTHLYRVKYPEAFNISIIIMGLGFLIQSSALGYNPFYSLAGLALIGMAIIDVSMYQFIHLSMALIGTISVVTITIMRLIDGDIVIPVIILGMTGLYILRFFYSDIYKGLNTSIFQKFILVLFVMLSVS